MNFEILTGDKGQAGSISSWVNYDKFDRLDVLQEAEQIICNSLRVREMRTLVTGTIQQGDESLEIPARYAGLIRLNWAGNVRCKVTLVDPPMFEQMISTETNGTLTTGLPSIVTEDATSFRFNLKADQAIPYRLWFWQRPQPLCPEHRTNFLTERYPHLLRAACLGTAYRFMKQFDKANAELSNAAAFIIQANANYDLEQAQEH